MDEREEERDKVTGKGTNSLLSFLFLPLQA